MFCPNCGTRLLDGSTTCSNCSCNAFPYIDAVNKWELYLQTHNISPTVVEEKNNPEEHKVKLNILIPAIIFYTVFIFFILFTFGGASTDPVENFKNTLEANEFVEEDGERYTKTESGVTITFDFDDYEFIEIANDVTYTYNYKKDSSKAVESDGDASITATYDFETESFKCDTVNVSSVYCDYYKDNIISNFNSVKKNFNDFIKDYVTVEELLGEES